MVARSRRNTVGVLATLTVLWWAPWNLVHPLDPSLVLATLHAPVWKKPLLTGVRIEIDTAALTLRLLVIWIGVGVWLGLSTSRWS